MKYCLQFNTAPIAIRAWMHAAIVEQEVETCLEHFTDEPHLALTTSGGRGPPDTDKGLNRTQFIPLHFAPVS